ncbi:Ribosomal protein L21 [Candidatus Omnitrophus magneticus]|uniref:Large ribosomal subunit protein bL21 n=1 Tax=Candidatus Omnitrophus magneticus TaxID=1609969 RepID=A0A0F0CLC4_9BACT|nr:Ribosomal protein L21 [Candidatus Omnitrophus magneticus]
MYAIIELNGEQIKVEKNKVFTVNRLKVETGKEVKADKVLFGKDGDNYYIGTPYVTGAYVDCEILRDTRAKKVIAFKYRDRKSSQSKKGHRQDITELKVKDICLAKS